MLKYEGLLDIIFICKLFDNMLKLVNVKNHQPVVESNIPIEFGLVLTILK
jgi:hypothetical protein